jgi:hypothetical protein
MQCTGISASWCPVHGDCTCPTNEHGETITMDGEELGKDNPDCPLHGIRTDHGEQIIASTLWGDFVLSGE